jgi:HJR/Mrr/RecB family endonuclease
MRVAKYLFPTSHRRRRRMFRRSKSSMFSAFWTIKFILNITVFLLSTVIGITIFTGSLLYKLIKRIRDYRHYKKNGFSYMKIYKDISKLSGRSFEILMYELFKTNGYKVKITPPTNDGGKDLIIWIDGIETYVELKRWSGSWHVGRPEIQKLIGSAVCDGVEKCLFITTGSYNNNALECAGKTDMIDLWDMENIMQLIKKTEPKKIPWIMSKAMEFNEEDMLKKMDNYSNRIENFNNSLDRQY